MIKKKSILATLCVTSFLGFYGISDVKAETNHYTEKTSMVEYNWGKGGPNGLTDHFTATFDQSQHLDAGDYFVQTLADDGVTVDVDGKKIIDRINYSSNLINRAYLTNVSEGNHYITTNYKEGVGSAVVFSHVVPFNDWLAYYYPNKSFSGTPVASKVIGGGDNGVLMERPWKNSPVPGVIPVDNYSARYFSAQRLEAGEYILRAGADDGLQVYVDGKLVLDRFTPIGYREDAVKLNIKDTAENKDIHFIEVKYKEGILSSRVNVSFQPYEEVMEPNLEDGWVGEIFPSEDFTGSSIIIGGKGATNLMDELDLNWKMSSPGIGIPKDSFSGQFYRKVNVNETGIYTMKIWADDKLRLFVDGDKLIDSWKYVPGSYREITIPLSKGEHDIRIEYQEGKLNARLKFLMSQENVDYEKTQTSLGYSWGKSSPISKVDHFTAKFDQSRYMEKGDYFVQTIADDGIYMVFDGKPVLNRWQYSSNTMDRTLLKDVPEGNHEITTLYREGTLSATLFSDIVRFDDWLAYYYPNESFSGMPKATKVIEANGEYGELREINWAKSPVPGSIPEDHFTAKYVTAKRLPAGEYVLRAGADDGLQVFIDGQLILDRFTPVGYREDAVKVSLKDSKENGDIHWVEVRYKEGILSSRLNVMLQPYTDVINPSIEDGWVGEYYPNQNLSGSPMIVGGKGATSKIENLDFYWGQNSPTPLLPKDYFSARFTKTINIDEAGYYVLNATADDGVRVYVDNELVLDSWKYQSPLLRKAGVNLDKGQHVIKVEYYDGRLAARLKLDIEKGKTTYSKTEKALRYNWGQGSPDVEVQPDHFTANFDQSQYLNAGDYFIQTLADDGVQVEFNGNKVIDRASYSWESLIDRAVMTNVPAGNQNIKTTYYEGTENAMLFSEIVKFGDWLAYYYPNMDVSGTPVGAKVISAESVYGGLKENNGYGSPITGVVPEDGFSAKYVTAKRIPAGEYVLRTGADDGVRVFVDGELVLDRFSTGGFREDSIKLKIEDVNTNVNQDIHWIEVHYKEASQASRVEVMLQPYQEAIDLSSSDGWLGEFYKNTNLSGESVIIGGKHALVPVEHLDFSWGNGAPTPLLPADYFSARFTKKVTVPTTGNYVMTVHADDGVRVKVDGVTKIDSWQYVSGNKRQITLEDLKAGTHTIEIEYYEGKLAATLKFDLQKVEATSFIELDLRKPADITAQDIVAFFDRKKPDSPLKKYAQDFINVQNKSGVNAQYLVAHAIWETGWGSSDLTVYKTNFFGYGAYDSCPFTCAYYFPSGYDSINYVAYQVKTDYLTSGGKYYNGANLIGMNVRYATDQNWKNGIASLMQSIKPFDAGYYNEVKVNTVIPPKPPAYSRDIPAGKPIPTHTFIDFPAGITAKVNTNLNYRSLPSTSGALLGTIPANTVIEVVGYNTDVRGNWYRVKYNGKIVWASGDYLTIHNLLKVQVDSTLSVREDATTTSDRITNVPNNTYLKAVLDDKGNMVTKNEWYLVYIPASTETGWVSGDYIKVIGK